MNDILFYLNKNTLLSNYTEEVITWKVKDLGIELSDLLFNCYESYFYYPTAEELFDKAKTVKDPCNISDYDLYMKCVQWSHEELQSKLRHYPLLVMNIVNAVHSAYLRALGGQERKSFRENFHNFNQPQDKSQVRKEVQLMKPSTW